MLQRQSSLIPSDTLDRKISIVGAGAVGSWTALLLAKMGFENIEIWDDDEVSIENMNNQAFGVDMIGKKKVDALAEMIKTQTEVEITTHPVKWEGDVFLDSDIVLCAADSMQVRKDTYEAIINDAWFIDTRMGAELFRMYTLRAGDMELYEKIWFPDAEGAEVPCTAKSTVYCAATLGGMVVGQVKNLLLGQYYIWNMTYSFPNCGADIFEKEVE